MATMSAASSSSSLDNELPIPSEAHLNPSITACLRAKSTGPGEHQENSILLNAETALRPSPRCLLVGRQAATADIRIQHGSISRKHAVFYYIGNDNTLMLQDLGGKHGTLVNGERIKKSASRQLLQGDKIQFGNVTTSIFEVVLPRNTSVAEKGSVEVGNGRSVKNKDGPSDDKFSHLSGREKREAEIAAMTASLDETPTYRPYEAPALDISTAGSKQEHRIGPSLAEKHQLPITETYSLPSPDPNDKHTVTCLAVDPAGSRFLVGVGPNLRFYDFASLDSQNRTGPFKTVTVQDGYPVVDVCWSPTGDKLLVATTSVQPKILGRDGEELLQFIRGDMYVMSTNKTTGHTAAVTGGVAWSPLEPLWTLTGSADGSARLWNLKGRTEFEKLVCSTTYPIKKKRGQRTTVTAIAYHPNGREFSVGTRCGSIQVWKTTQVTSLPVRAVYGAHSSDKKPDGSGPEIQSIVYNVDGTKLASRAGGHSDDGVSDDTVRIWNAPKLSASDALLSICLGLPSENERTNSTFSPNSKFIIAGTSEYRRDNEGKLGQLGEVKLFKLPSSKKQAASKGPINLSSLLTLSTRTGVGVIQVRWHSKLNQIFAAFSDGSLHIYFDRTCSSKGATGAAGRQLGKQQDALSELLTSRMPTGSAGGLRRLEDIQTPNALPLFGGRNRRKREQEREESEAKKHKPMPPSSAKIMAGGGSSATVTFQQFVANSSLSRNKDMLAKKSRDPRDELFRYQEGKDYMRAAGDTTVVLAKRTVEEEEEELKKK